MFWISWWANCAQLNTSRYLYAGTISWYPSWSTQKTFNRWANYISRTSSQYCWSLYGSSSSLRTYFRIGSSTDSTNPNYPWIYSNWSSIYSSWNRPDWTWKNYVVVFDGTKTYMYINWVKLGEATFSWATNLPTSSEPFVIWRRTTGDTSYQVDTHCLSRFIIEDISWTEKDILKYFKKTKKIFWL